VSFAVDNTYPARVTVTAVSGSGATSSAWFAGMGTESTQVDIPAGMKSRVWSGRMSFTQSGCYSLKMTGPNLDETIAIWVNPGNA
jgi:hypothetical protein